MTNPVYQNRARLYTPLALGLAMLVAGCAPDVRPVGGSGLTVHARVDTSVMRETCAEVEMPACGNGP